MEKEEPVAQSATTSEPVPELKLTPTPTPTPAPTPAATQPAAVEDEEESDWEDLDGRRALPKGEHLCSFPRVNI